MAIFSTITWLILIKLYVTNYYKVWTKFSWLVYWISVWKTRKGLWLWQCILHEYPNFYASFTCYWNYTYPLYCHNFLQTYNSTLTFIMQCTYRSCFLLVVHNSPFFVKVRPSSSCRSFRSWMSKNVKKDSVAYLKIIEIHASIFHCGCLKRLSVVFHLNRFQAASKNKNSSKIFAWKKFSQVHISYLLCFIDVQFWRW